MDMDGWTCPIYINIRCLENGTSAWHARPLCFHTVLLPSQAPEKQLAEAEDQMIVSDLTVLFIGNIMGINLRPKPMKFRFVQTSEIPCKQWGFESCNFRVYFQKPRYSMYMKCRAEVAYGVAYPPLILQVDAWGIWRRTTSRIQTEIHVGIAGTYWKQRLNRKDLHGNI